MTLPELLQEKGDFNYAIVNQNTVKRELPANQSFSIQSTTYLLVVQPYHLSRRLDLVVDPHVYIKHTLNNIKLKIKNSPV
jgi:hypothetical protein